MQRSDRPTTSSLDRQHDLSGRGKVEVGTTDDEVDVMGKVILAASVSLDGFIARENDDVGPLFDWYGNGDVAATLGDPGRVFHVSVASAGYLRAIGSVRTAVIGRHLFDITNGWNGVPAVGSHVFVVTHERPVGWAFPNAPFTFVTDGVASAVAQALAVAGDGDVSVAAGDVGGQAVAASLVDEVHMSVVPVLFVTGKRFFGSLAGGQRLLENPQVIEGDRVVHLIYGMRRGARSSV